ncbi:MAG: glycosyltransferase [Patescibacteria group bacterium]
MNTPGNNVTKIAIVFPKDSEAIFNINSKRPFGGATVQPYLLAKALWHVPNVCIYSFIADYPTIDFPDHAEFRLVKTFSENDSVIKKLIRFHQKITAMKPDIILQRGLSPFSCLLALYCKMKKIKFVYMLASDVESDGRYQRSNRPCPYFRLLKYAHLLIAQNRFQQERLSTKYRLSSEILYSGYEIRPDQPHKNDTVLWVGRRDPMKHAEEFIELARRNPARRFILICPPGKDETHNEQIKALARKTANVQLLEFVSFNVIEQYYRDARVLVNTSDYEGFPQTFVQAAKNWTPILSKNVDPEGFITSYQCGYVANGDLQTLNDNLQKLFSDNSLYTTLSANAHHYAEKNHDINNVVTRLFTLLHVND